MPAGFKLRPRLELSARSCNGFKGTKSIPKLLLCVWLLVPASGIAEPLRVFVSLLPQKTFVEKIGAQHVDVVAMVRPGYNPSTYDPTPQQIAALAEAALYVRAGVPFERAWMKRIRSVNREMRELDAHAGIAACEFEAHEEDSESPHRQEQGSGVDPPTAPASSLGTDRRAHGIKNCDPHVWTNPLLVKRMARSIRDKLSELDPENASDYSRNYVAFASELDALDRDLRSLLEDLPSRRFMVYHPAWGHFADAYGLVEVPIETDGKEPGPRALVALIERARRDGVKAIFVQPQFSEKSAEQVARAIGARVIRVDPLSPDYTDNLREVARQFAEAVRG